jgi:hypothetical protein
VDPSVCGKIDELHEGQYYTDRRTTGDMAFRHQRKVSYRRLTRSERCETGRLQFSASIIPISQPDNECGTADRIGEVLG